MNGIPFSAEAAESPPSVFAGYRSPADAFDELFDATRTARPHWRPFVAQWEALGSDAMLRCSADAWRLLRENGTTHTSHGDPAATRPWAVDIFPLVISPSEWREISHGVAQRARLLDAIIRDVYTEGRLLADRRLPPALVFAHPGFLRPCHGVRVPGDTFLHLYAADLVRMTDGRWHVVADRTDAPLGLGYSLENRLVLARLFPALFHEGRIERLAPFFLALQQSLRELAPAHRDNPRIVLLSEGPECFHYIEDAYLARYLNHTLVEAGDLAVRDERVWLKTLSGLLPVDVIFRRLSDELCDPLEFGGDAAVGVPGLLQAVRAGHVAVVNALGSSLVQTPALQNLLPALCRTLLGEELQLASVETWWSGAAELRQGILGMADGLVIGPAFPHRESSGNAPARAKPEELVNLLREEPFSLVALAPFPRSVAPVWEKGGAKPAPISLRVFAAWTPRGYRLMPGGLVRVVKDMRILDPALWVGETSKDAWVVAEGAVAQVSLLPPSGQAVELRRGAAELPSRVAEFGRRLERALHTITLVKAFLAFGGHDRTPLLEALLQVADSQMTYRSRYLANLRLAPVLDLLLTDETNPRSLAFQLAAIELNQRIHQDFRYDKEATDVQTHVLDVFRNRSGVCQDLAHVAIGCLRSIGLPARYVSGYLRTIPPAGKPRLVGADASHAWIAVYCGRWGWLDFDPTNDCMPLDQHITLAWGRDYGDVAPVRGVFVGGGKHQVFVSVDVTPLDGTATGGDEVPE